MAKCCPEDNFDVYTGTQLALERAYGKENNEVREVKRKAKVGEYIKIVDAFITGGKYTKGDIFKVKSMFGVGGVLVEEHEIVILHNEYVVLENYKPKKTQLTLNNGQCGIVGQKTTLVDLYGNELYIGDIVNLYYINSGFKGERCICHYKTCGDFVMGIAGSTIKNGISDDNFVIVKKRSYKDFKDGDVVDDIKYTLTEVE